jgi:predicted transcriptional regulator
MARKSADARKNASSEPPFRTVTVRMPTEMHEQLRELAFHTRTPQHTLIMEGINLMFRRHQKPVVAMKGA